MVSLTTLVKPDNAIRGHKHVFESTLCFFADSIRCGRVALSVLYEPKTSISITDRNAFTEIWLIEARKFPAAPALHPT
jgi:hypothetical protein